MSSIKRVRALFLTWSHRYGYSLNDTLETLTVKPTLANRPVSYSADNVTFACFPFMTTTLLLLLFMMLFRKLGVFTNGLANELPPTPGLAGTTGFPMPWLVELSAPPGLTTPGAPAFMLPGPAGAGGYPVLLQPSQPQPWPRARHRLLCLKSLHTHCWSWSQRPDACILCLQNATQPSVPQPPSGRLTSLESTSSSSDAVAFPMLAPLVVPRPNPSRTNGTRRVTKENRSMVE